jgi:arabinogalactan endo-1,4-beta-galactosidase
MRLRDGWVASPKYRILGLACAAALWQCATDKPLAGAAGAPAAGESGHSRMGIGPSSAADAAAGGAGASSSAGAAGENAGAGGSKSSSAGTPSDAPRADAGAAGASGTTPDAAAMDGSGGSGAISTPSLYIGADITWVQADEVRGATYSDGSNSGILQVLQAHGFNYVRLRTFVDPKAADGYDPTDGFGDLAHTISFGKRIKAAGMGLLVDFHYSDNWADPGKQCVPVAWQKLASIDALAGAVGDYTRDAITQLMAGGARPDMVQIGNEITPGMLIHRCNQDGQPMGNNPVTGSISNWANLGALLKSASEAVKSVDPTIQVMIHIDRGDDLTASRQYIENATKQAVMFDVFGESCYTAYQGPPSGWKSTFTQLAAMFPKLKFVIAEYGPEQRAANDLIYGLANRAGLGTFNWEPTRSGDWNQGHVLFSTSGNKHTATADLQLYDAMKSAYADRL